MPCPFRTASRSTMRAECAVAHRDMSPRDDVATPEWRHVQKGLGADRGLGLGDDVDELAGRLVLEDQLAPAVGHLLLLDHRLAAVLAPRARHPLPVAAAPGRAPPLRP